MVIYAIIGDPVNAETDMFVDLSEVIEPAAVLQESHQWYTKHAVSCRFCYF